MLKNTNTKLLSLVVFASIIGLVILNWQAIADFQPGKMASNITSGRVLVMFKPEVSEQEAISVLNKYGLSGSEKFYKYDYIMFYSTENSLNNSLQIIGKLPLVAKAEIVSPANKSVKPWIVADFTKFLSLEEINEMISPYKDIYIDDSFFEVNIQNIVVPAGKERFFAEKLQLDPKVKFAEVDTIVKIQ